MSHICYNKKIIIVIFAAFFASNFHIINIIMAYTEVKRTTYGQQVGSSFKGIGGGAVLFIAATVLLWWNEGRAVHTAQDIKEMGKNAVHVDNITSVDSSLEGQLVHMNGKTATTDVLTDGMFGVSVNAIALERKVEYYQWVEHSRTETKESLGGTKEEITTYTYEREWVGHTVNSSDFKDPEYKNVNSVLVQIDDKDMRATNVTFGAYSIPESMMYTISTMYRHDLPLSLSYDALNELDNQMLSKLPVSEQASLSSAKASMLKDSVQSLAMVHQSGNIIYLGRNASNPAVGDVRVSFHVSDPGDISLVAVVNGNTFRPYHTKNGSDDTFVHAGTKTLEQMVQSEEEGNTMLTWILRLIGLVLVCAGLKGIFGILSTLLKVVPFLANILNWGVTLICNVVGFVWTLVIIAIAWIFYRPVLGISLLIIAGAAIYFLATRGKGKKSVEPQS